MRTVRVHPEVRNQEWVQLALPALNKLAEKGYQIQLTRTRVLVQKRPGRRILGAGNAQEGGVVSQTPRVPF